MSNITDFYPVGAVALFGGTLPPENRDWLLCDGRGFNTGDYPELFTAIGYIYGGDPEASVFKIPDYRGRFLRGAAHESPVDPDRTRRESVHPRKETEPEGIGTVQEYATKVPSGKDKGFIARFDHLPTSSKSTHGVTRPGNTGYGSSSTVLQDTCTTGGDKESRPINIYLNCYIKSRS